VREILNMIKIALVVPLKDYIENAQSTFMLHNSKYGTWKGEEYVLEEIVASSDELVHFKTDADAIIARGLYAEILKNMNSDIPIVEIVVQGSDMIENLMECKQRFGDRQIGVIAAQNMVYDLEEMPEITGLKFKSYAIKGNFIGEVIVKRAIHEGCEIILGGTSSCEAAKRLGVDNMLIKTGQKSFYQSITEAKRAAKMSRKAQEKSNIYKTILDYTYEGIIAISSDNKIILMNTCAKQMLNIEANAVGSDIKSAQLSQELTNIIQDDKEYINEIIQKNDEPIMLSKVFTYIKGEKFGCVVTIQKIQHIQSMEGVIRENIINSGHDAKYTFDDIVAVSDVTKDIVGLAKKFSLTESNILLTGESGTGKEIFAQSIHNFSNRKKGPFVAVNCASLPENLLESELFGYASGAFTGASKSGKLGFFGLANNGTIFLDEIGEMPLGLQSKLLRVLQERQFTRLGDNKVVKVDIRIIAATNKDLNKLVKQSMFRKDLLYRLDVLRINIPALDDRSEDIPVLAERFIKRLNPHKTLSEKAKELLKGYNWEGNVRQVQNFCERLDALSTSRIITEEDILYIQRLTPSSMDAGETHNAISAEDISRQNEEQLIREALVRTKYNRQNAARLLNINRSTLWRKMKEYGIE
jgi:transcriptional regulator with PAS, ATPase and Fis domain